MILSNGLDAPGISRMNHFTAEIVSLVKHLSRKVFSSNLRCPKMIKIPFCNELMIIVR